MDQVLAHLRGVSGYDGQGREVPDPRPMSVVVDIEAEMPLEMKVMRALRSDRWKRMMEQQGGETFEEADDFEVNEEPEFKSRHEEEDGDLLAFEEGIRRGFVEEIPAERRAEVEKTVKAFETYRAAKLAGDKSGAKPS